MKPKFYFCEVFRENYWFFINWKERDVLNYLESFFDIAGINLKQRAGMAIDFGKAKVIYINKNQIKTNLYAVLAHECIHAANMTFASRNVVQTSDELLAYYVENLIRKALE